MSGRPSTNRQVHAHTISAHALELFRDHGQDKILSSFPVNEVIAEPFAVQHSIAVSILA